MYWSDPLQPRWAHNAEAQVVPDLGSRNHGVQVHAGGCGPGHGPARSQGARARAAENRTMRTRRVDRTTRTRMLMEYTWDMGEDPGPWPGELTRGCTRDRDSRTAREAACARKRDENETRRNTDTRRRPSRLFIMGESIGRSLGTPAICARPEIEAE